MGLCFVLLDGFLKFSPRYQMRNPVIFCVFVGAIFTSGLYFQALFGVGEAKSSFIIAVSLLLWLTVYFANIAESAAESRGKAHARSLRKMRHELQAKKLSMVSSKSPYTVIPSSDLRLGDIVLVKAKELIPGDGEVIEGIASVDESAITGESAPVIRDKTEERNSVTGGTRVISDWLIIRIIVNPGESFLDHIIGLIEGSKRQKTPNEIALSVFLAALTIIFLLVCVTLLPLSIYSLSSTTPVITVTVLIALFVCLAPTTIGSLLSAIGIAGMDRMIRSNVIALSGRSVEAAGDVDVLLLDKTGTITLGNRQATEFIPAPGVSLEEFVDSVQLASFADETPEGRSIVILCKKKYGFREKHLENLNPTFIPFSAHTRMSGVDLQGRCIRKGAAESIEAHLKKQGGSFTNEMRQQVETIAKQGETPLVVAEGARVLGFIRLKDIIKSGIRERFFELRRMGIKTIMITGDNALTAASIAAEAGVDDFLANANPEDKLILVRKLQAKGHLVAMTGDGTNDAPALAQADVAVAMNTGTQAAKEAGNLLDLDSNPTKLIEIVEIGKQMLMTRGALTTFSIANDVAKYFAILPSAFSPIYPELQLLNLMKLSSPQNAILSAVIFNAFIIIALVPLALKGVHYKRVSAINILRANVLIYGLGGLLVPFIGIKLIDFLLCLL